jgi:hypothetical protein
MLTDDELQKVLLVTGSSMRRRKRPLSDLQPTYVSALRKKAFGVIEDWIQRGVPTKIWRTVENYTDLVSKFNLTAVQEEPTASPCNVVIL